jgi:diguanylate cyclase (GGDEF)-like protein
VLFIDIDHFKSFNDVFSYAVGDTVLRELSQALKHNVRETDVVGRYGGEELVVLFPDTDRTVALHTAERLRQLIESLPVPTEYGLQALTVSIGVSVLMPAPALQKLASSQLFARLVDTASQVLKNAKTTGRNRVLASDA